MGYATPVSPRVRSSIRENSKKVELATVMRARAHMP